MFALLLALISPACHLIQSEWLYGHDLAAAAPALSNIAPDVRIGLAPVPGAQRVFRVPELKRIAAANHLDANPENDVCFSWKLSVPDRAAMLTAMLKELDGRAPSIEIVESSLMPAPDGEIVFPLSGLVFGSDKASVWRGYIHYADGKKFPIWARAIVRVKEQHLIAAVEIREGETLGVAKTRLETFEGPVRREKYLTNTTQIEGMLARRSISSGTALLLEMVESPREVSRGDTVSVIVQTGAARLEVQVLAETDGRKGEIISVRNPRSGRSFRARVEEKGVATVVPGGQFGLVVEGKKS
jgi:flagella basal body P-ring formation protein FlgA